MSAAPSPIIELVWDRVAVLLPAHKVTHPLGYHRRRCLPGDDATPS